MSFRTMAAAAVLAAGAATSANAQVVTIASNPQGSIFYSASVAIAKVMDEKLKTQVRVQPMGGSSTYIPLLNRGEVDFGLTNVDDALNSYRGTGNFPRANPDLRLTAVAFPLTLSALVANDSDIKTIADLKGKRLPWGYQSQTTGLVLQRALLANAGLTMEDVVAVPTPSLFSGVDLLGEGKVDAAVISIGTAQGQRANVALASRGGVRFLNLDSSPEAVAAVRKHLPARPYPVEPAPHRIGIVGPTTVMAYSIFFTTHARMSEDRVYALVKAMHESKADLVKGHPVFGAFEPGAMTEEIGVPWHPGALKFYKEIGQWPPKG